MTGCRYRRAMTSSTTRLALLDLLVGLTATGVYIGFASIGADDGQPYFTGPLWLGCLIAMAVGLPVAIRRRCPLAALVIVVLGLGTAALADIVREPFLPAGLVAYLVGLAEPMRRSGPALAAALLTAGTAVYLAEAVVTPGEDVRGAVGTVALVTLTIVGGWGAGAVVRARRAETRRGERDRHAAALAAERQEIARELHDIVSHHLSLIAVRSGVARHIAQDDPAAARDALRDIETTSRSALTEMRRTLGVLRGDGDRAPLSPPVDPEGLESLADQASGAGVDTVLSVEGVAELTDGVRATVYRIVQEALTNAVSHASPTRCWATVRVRDGEVLVDVVDEGPPPDRAEPPTRSDPPGYGLVGIRERVAIHRGGFHAGPRAQGGFAVSARLPIGAGADR